MTTSGRSDLLIDPESWKISFLAIDSGDWLLGKLVVIAPAWASEQSWHTTNSNADQQGKNSEQPAAEWSERSAQLI